jgi:RES domain-containing protein
MIVYRIGKSDYIKDLSGEGARLYGGRWNYPGYRALYTSESLALAVLEYIIKTGLVQDEINNLSIAYIEISDHAALKNIDLKFLPDNWNNYPAPEELKRIGTKWLISNDSLILRIPAISVPDSFNILINPSHPEFEYVKLKKVKKYNPDIRLKNK